MNRSRLFIIGLLAVVAGFFASVYVYKNLQKGGSSENPGVEVMVAADDLQVGSRIEDRDIKKIWIPAADLPPDAPRRTADVKGHGVILPIAKGEFILKSHVADENAGSGLPSLIPPGMRAVSVRVNEVVSVAGFVTPGTRVDVLLTGTPNGGAEQVTTTVLQNITVLAAGHTLERNSNGEAQNTAVITLLVTPDDAEKLALASTEGHIQLALRNLLDTKQDDVVAASSRGLYKSGMPVVTPPVVHHVAPKKVVAAPPPVSNGMNIEVYQGDKRSNVKCTEDNCGEK